MFDAGTISAALTLDRTPFMADLAVARAEAAKGVHVPVTFDVSQNAAMRAVVAARAVFRSNPITIPITFTVSQAQAMAGIVAARAAFRANPITVPIGFSVSQAAILRTVAAAKALLRFSPIPVPVSLSVSPAEMARVGTELQAWFLANPVIVPVRLGPPAGGLGNLGGAGAGGMGGLGGLLGKKITLFGGMLGTNALTGEIAMWHILVDWVIEFAAVLIPAAIALGAFGIAGFNTAKAIFTNFQNVRTIVSATGQSFGMVAAGASKAAQAVKPQVYQLWGDAITLATQKGGTFATMAHATGTALDQLGARFTVAVTGGSHMGGVMSAGASDVAKLGDVVGNLGGTLGNVMKAVPGFADDFLNLWVAVSKGAEVLTSVTVPALNVLLWAHGLILYGGLAVTAIMKIGPAILAAGNAVIDFAFMAAAEIGVFIGNVIAAQGAVATFEVISDALTPWGWVAIGVAAIAGLIYLLTRGKDETQDWLNSLQSGITAAQAVSNGMAMVGTAQVQVTQRLAAAQAKLATITRYAAGLGPRGSKAQTAAYTAQLAVVQELTSGSRQLTDEQNLSRYRLAALTTAYGSQHHAMGLLAAAGITEKQWLDKSASTWAQIQQQVAATELGYVQMGVTGGALGNDLQVMNRQVTAQYQAMTKLNGALDTWIKDVTGTQSAFDGFAQGFATLTTNEKAAGASMDGLNASSITLNSSFATQVTNANALFDTWRLAGVASNLQVKGIKAAVGALTPFAKGSREATAQLVALAEQAGYDGPATMQRLNLWLGKTHGSMATLKQITNQATMQEALLSGAMRGQGDLIANQLLRQLNDAIIKYGGVSAAVQAYGKAIATQGAQSDAAKQARATLIQDLITTGQRAGESAKQIGAMITKITGIPAQKAVQIVVTGSGSYTVTGQSVSAGPSHRFQAAAGMLVTGGTPNRDSVLVNAMPGELIVPTRLVKRGAVDHLRGQIPGFGAGGVVGSYGGTPPGLGSFDVREYNATTSLIEAADAAAASAAIRAAVTHAKAVQARAFGVGAGSGGSSAGGSLGRAGLRQIEDWWMGAGGPGGIIAHIAAAITGAESGFNPGIVQAGQPYATTGWGLWQITPGDSEPQAGVNQQLLTGPSNAVAAVAKYRGAGGFSPWTTFRDGAYLQFMDQGGWMPPGLNMVVNGTGRPEAAVPAVEFENLIEAVDHVAGMVGQLIGAVRQNAGDTAHGIAQALGAAAQGAMHRAEYSPR